MGSRPAPAFSYGIDLSLSSDAAIEGRFDFVSFLERPKIESIRAERCSLIAAQRSDYRAAQAEFYRN